MLDEFSALDAWKQVKDKEVYACFFKEYSEKAYPNRAYLYNVSTSFLYKASEALAFIFIRL